MPYNPTITCAGCGGDGKAQDEINPCRSCAGKGTVPFDSRAVHALSGRLGYGGDRPDDGQTRDEWEGLR